MPRPLPSPTSISSAPLLDTTGRTVSVPQTVSRWRARFCRGGPHNARSSLPSLTARPRISSRLLPAEDLVSLLLPQSWQGGRRG